MRAAIRIFLVFSLIAVVIIEGAALLHRLHGDLPWTALDLTAPPGRSTAAKIADLGSDPPRCRALLALGGSRARPAPDRIASANCGYRDGTRIVGETLAPAPAGLVTSCPVAAALLLWERDLQAEAQRMLGTRVVRLLHAGSYSCRRLYNRSEGAWSEHATADALDVLGFVMADGRSLSVLRDWPGDGPEAAFLQAARTSACASFTTVLSPDYNASHRDHLHLDTADRGPGGWRACR